MPSLLLLLLVTLGLAPWPPAGNAAPQRKTVAVLAFDNNTGKADYDPLGRGMAAMMTSDLASVKALQLLERDQLDEVTREIDAQRTRYFDSTTAVRIGRLAGAQFLLVGSLAAADPQLRIDTRLVRVETGAIVKTARVTGPQEEFFDLQKKLVKQLVRDLDVALAPDDSTRLEAALEANRVDMAAVLRVSTALNLADAGDYGGATLKIAPVVARYPNSTFVKLTADEIKRRSTRASEQKARTKINDGVNKLIKRKWPPATVP